MFLCTAFLRNMASPAPICDECGTVFNVPGTIATPVEADNAHRLTAEQKYNLNIVCPSEPEIMGAQQPQLSNNDVTQQQQQEDEDFEKTLQLELELFLSDPLQEIDGKLVHQGQNPCRYCYQRGSHCVKLPGSDSCTSCQYRRRNCHKSLVGAKPRGHWVNRIVLHYSAPLFINASRVWDGPDGGDIIEYRVKYPFKFGRTKWVAAEDLKEYVWILKKFHHDMPNMPGPPEWLIEEEDDEFFYGDSDHLPM